MRKSRSIVDIGGGVNHKLQHRHKIGVGTGEADYNRAMEASQQIAAKAVQQTRAPYRQQQVPKLEIGRAGIRENGEPSVNAGGLSARVYNQPRANEIKYGLQEESPYGTSDLRASEVLPFDPSKQTFVSTQGMEDTLRQIKERERLLNKSLSLTKGAASTTMYNANKLKTQSFIKSGHSGFPYASPFDQVLGLRTSSNYGKNRNQGQYLNNLSATSKKQASSTIRNQPLRFGLSNNRREKSNIKNASINSRMVNARPINNLSKNMSINENTMPESVILASRRFKGQDLNLNNMSNQYEEVSMGSICSFEESRKQQNYKMQQSFKDSKGRLSLGIGTSDFNPLSPNKQATVPIPSGKQQQNRYWDDKFNTQTASIIDNGSQTRQLDSSIISKGGPNVQVMRQATRKAPLTQKHSQAPKISEKEFMAGQKIHTTSSPFKNQRLSFLVKNKLMVSGKLPKTYQSSAKQCKTQREGNFTGRQSHIPVTSKFDQSNNQQSSRLRYNANGTISEKISNHVGKATQNQGTGHKAIQRNPLRENRSSKNLHGGVSEPAMDDPAYPEELSGSKQHKRSMTLKTRNALKEQVGDTFQSIMEEPAEDNIKSVENKSIDHASNAAPELITDNHFSLNSSRIPSQFVAAQFNQSIDIRIPQTTQNKNSDKIHISLNTIQVQQQYGLVSEKNSTEANNQGGNQDDQVINDKSNKKLATQNPQTNQQKGQDYSYASIENKKAEVKVPKYQAPQNARNRSFLRTTRNTLTQQTPKQMSIPDQLSFSNKLSTKINSNSIKGSDSWQPSLAAQEFKKNAMKFGKNYAKVVASNSRSTSIQKSSQNPHVAVSGKGVKTSANDSYQVSSSIIGKQASAKQKLYESNLYDSALSKGYQSKPHSKERPQPFKFQGEEQEVYSATGPQKKNQTGKKAKMLEAVIHQATPDKPQLVQTTNNPKDHDPEATSLSSRIVPGASSGAVHKQVFTNTLKKLQKSNERASAREGGVKRAQGLSSTDEAQINEYMLGDSMEPSNLKTGKGDKQSRNVFNAQQRISYSSIDQQKSISLRKPEFPLSAEEALEYYSNNLNDFEKQEIVNYCGKIYYFGQNCKNKVKGHAIKMVPPLNQSKSRQSKDRRTSVPEAPNGNQMSSSQQQHLVPSQRQIERLKMMDIFNYGYDDENGDYKTVLKDHIGYRFEVLEQLGSGSFGQALKCLDHSNGSIVAIKIIRNKKKFQYQAGMELKILLYLNQHDKHDQYNIIRVKDFVLFREHLIIAFELLSINLYDFIKNNNFVGVSQNLIRRFAIQILQALKYQHDHSLVHCDLKPENILLKQENKSGIKVIDYGSSCFMGQRIYTYIQSRFYRAPEIILGIPYTTAIDMWSFGAIVAELFTGFPLFPGESEHEQLAYIMELYGVPPETVLRMAQRRDIFFTKDFQPKLQPNSRGKIRQPLSKRLEDLLRCTDTNFLDFLNKCFIWDPVKRMTALEALQHPWILQGLPENVLEHHKKMFGYKDDRSKLRKLTHTAIQGFPKDKKETTIQEILAEIKADIEKDKQKQRQQQQMQTQSSMSKNRSVNSRNQLNRQTFSTTEGVKSTQTKEDSQIKMLKSHKSQKSQKGVLHNMRDKPQMIEVAQIHLHANKLLNTQAILSSQKGNLTTKHSKQSPLKERKSRKQRMENQELKLVNRLAQFKNIDQPSKEGKSIITSTKITKGDLLKKSKSIKIYDKLPHDQTINSNFNDYSDFDPNQIQQAQLQNPSAHDSLLQNQHHPFTQSLIQPNQSSSILQPLKNNYIQSGAPAKHGAHDDQKMSIESNSEAGGADQLVGPDFEEGRESDHARYQDPSGYFERQ